MIRDEVGKTLKQYLGVDEVPFNVPPKREMGDFSSAICLSLAKERRRSPMEIAKEAARQLQANLPPFVKEVAITPPGYLNFKVDWSGLSRSLLSRVLTSEVPFGKPSTVRKEKVFVEHTSVNPNKSMHIGHLRNSVLGDTVARVLAWLGAPVEVCNYIDDTGVQVVDVVTALLYMDPPAYEEGAPDFEAVWAKAPGDRPFDDFCWDIYARFQTRMEANPSLREFREDVLHKIEGGTHPIAGFAKDLATRIVHAHLATVSQLSIYYDLLNWESDIIRSGFWGATFELLKERGTLRLEAEGPNQGCWVVPLGGVVQTEEGLRSLDKILVRSNGSVTYTGKDIAYQLWKFGLLSRDFRYRAWAVQPNGKTLWTTAQDGDPGDRLPHRFGHAGSVINVIDVRQSYPQQVVIECLRQVGFEKEADHSIHLAYEVVNLSAQAARLLRVDAAEESNDRKAVAMSGRSGTGVKANDFIRLVKEKVIEKSDHVLEESVASALARAAIRYYLMKFTIESQIIFDFDEALKTTGDTGIYLEYAHARACSILRKAEERGISPRWQEDVVPPALTATERDLMEALSRFPSTVLAVGRTLRVSQLAEYAFNLASSFTDFYEHPDPGAETQTPFIHLRDEKLQAFRLNLVRAFQRVMASVLDLMGMPTLERI